MKTILLIITGLLLSANLSFAQGNAGNLIWSDEFGGTSLNGHNWEIQTGTGTSVGLTDWGNNEQQYYAAENISLKDGMLVITARKEQKGNKQYTSARLRTFGKFAKTYGYFEARISLPAIQGMWGAFWMMPETNFYGGWAASGEIDIMESKGRLGDRYSGAIHFGGQWPANRYLWTGDYVFPNNSTLDDFHVYGLEWKPGVIRWYCDNKLVKEISNWDGNATKPFDKDFHILLNLAVGGNFDENKMPPSGFTSAEMKVDYVRVYDEKPSSNESTQEEAGITIFQSDEQITIHSPQAIKTADLYSLDGKLTARTENRNTINTSRLNKGNYVLKVEDSTQKTAVFKLLVK